MKIIITGSKGQLGRSIRDLSPGYPELAIVFTDVEELDISDSAEVNHFFEQETPALVINCAAYTAVDKAEKEVVLADKINHLAVANLALACKKIGARLIHVSTDYLFDGTKSSPYHEKDIVRPQSVYGITKLGGETAILQSRIPSIIIRMITAGEQTGKIDAMLERISDFLDEEIETTLSGITSLIEPILIVFLGVVIGGMVICMFLPIFKMADIINPSGR